MKQAHKWKSLRLLIEHKLRGPRAQLSAAASADDALQELVERLAREVWAEMALSGQSPLHRNTWRTWQLLRPYRALSLSGRLAVALVVFQRWLSEQKLHDLEVQALLEHQWRWLTVGPDFFDAWHEADLALLDTAFAGKALPESTSEHCVAVGVDPRRLTLLLVHVTEIVEGSLFSATHDHESLRGLGVVLEVAAEDGVQAPPAAWFARLQWQDHHGWGLRLSVEELEQLRARSGG